MVALSWKHVSSAAFASLLWLLATVTVSSMVVEDIYSDEVFQPESEADVDQMLPSAPLCTPCREILKQIGWNCPLITPIDNISVDTIVGRWYQLEGITDMGGRKDACAGVDFWRWEYNPEEKGNLSRQEIRSFEDNSLITKLEISLPPDRRPLIIVMRGFNRQGIERDSGFRFDVTSVVDGSGGAIWDQTEAGRTTGLMVAVLDYTADHRILTLTTCDPTSGRGWTSVLGRSPNATDVPRHELHRRLRAAGVAHVDRAVAQDNRACAYPTSYKYRRPGSAHVRTPA